MAMKSTFPSGTRSHGELSGVSRPGPAAIAPRACCPVPATVSTRRVSRSARQLRSEWIAGHDAPVFRDGVADRREAERDPMREPRHDAVGQARDGRLLVDDDGDAERARRQRWRQGHEAASGEEE